MYDAIKNVCQENKVPLLSIKISEDYESFVRSSLLAYDVLKKRKERFSFTEYEVAVYTIMFFHENGEIDGKKKYEEYLDYLVTKNALSSKKSWNMMRGFLRDKNFILPTEKQHKVDINQSILKLLSHNKVCLYIFNQ